MKHRKLILWLLLIVAVLLTGCAMQTIDQMYCLPKRPEGYLNLQSVMDQAMSGLSYHAPISGDHQQPVQMKDLDGDGTDECLVFAKGNDENPLKVLIFRQEGNRYILADKLEASGTDFDQVLYIHFTDRVGYDLVIGRCQNSSQKIRPFTMYTMKEGKMQQIRATNHIRFLTTDFEEDGLDELVLIRRGESVTAAGYIEVLSCKDGIVESQGFRMSVPADNLKRILLSDTNDGKRGLYITSVLDDGAVITDVVAAGDEAVTNITLNRESGYSSETLRYSPAYEADLDNDGVLEIPEVLPAASSDGTNQAQQLLRWFSVNSDGTTVDKYYTCHNFTNGWFLTLPEIAARSVTVTPFGNSFEFSFDDPDGTRTRLLTIYIFTGQEREELAVTDNRFVLLRNESTVYAGHLDVASAAYNMNQEYLINAFHLIDSQQLVDRGEIL